MKKESILTGAIILTFSGFITRVIGFGYRVYMTGMIGSEGMGLYQLIMPVYLLAWTITSSGITTTVSSLSAKYTSSKKYNESLGVLYCAVMITAFLSLLLELIVLFFAHIIAEFFIKDTRACLSLKIIALCFPFMSVGSSIRGYFYGTQNTTIPAISQITEQLVRVFTVVGIFTIFTPVNLSDACGVTALGITMGEIISFIFTLVAFINLRKTINADRLKIKPYRHLSEIFHSAIPLSSGRILSSALSTAENMLIPQKLIAFGYSESNALSVYGKLTGMAMPLIQFPTAILTSFSTALIPAISSAEDIKNNSFIKHTIEKSLLFSSCAGMWAFTVFIFLPKEVSYLLYNQSSLGNMVIKLAPICPLLYTHITLSGILNGCRKQNIIFANNIISSLINLLFIYVFMASTGIDAFIIGLITSLVVTGAISITVIKHSADIKISLKKCIIKPLVCSIVSGIVLKIIPFNSDSCKINILVLLAILSFIYAVLLCATKTISKADIVSILPKSFKRKKQA